MKSYRGLFFGTLIALVMFVAIGVGYVVGSGAAPSDAEAAQVRDQSRQLAFDSAKAHAAAKARARGRADGVAEGRKVGAAAGKKDGLTAAKKQKAKKKAAQAKAPVAAQAPSGGSLAAAVAKVASLGYTASDTSTYQPGNVLHVLIGVRTGSADGYGRQAFFFVGDKYLGTDTSDPSASMNIAWQDTSLAAINYSLYNTNDPFCCPTGSATVRYQWNGSHLVPLDPIPTSEDTDGSRL